MSNPRMNKVLRSNVLKLAILPTALVLVAAAIVCWALANDDDSEASPKPDPVVGVWFVNAPDAPFTHHMFAFHADGTMGQANPDAGNPNTSDSDGLGIWKRSGKSITGKFVEVTADRETHKLATRGEISFKFTVTGDKFTGTADAHFFDVDGKHVRGPLATALEGTRVTLS